MSWQMPQQAVLRPKRRCCRINDNVLLIGLALIRQGTAVAQFGWNLLHALRFHKVPEDAGVLVLVSSSQWSMISKLETAKPSQAQPSVHMHPLTGRKCRFRLGLLRKDLTPAAGPRAWATLDMWEGPSLEVD
jgi:hypothetical protein